MQRIHCDGPGCDESRMSPMDGDWIGVRITVAPALMDFHNRECLMNYMRAEFGA